MATDDRKLLELAAKAAGYDIDWRDWRDLGSHIKYKNRTTGQWWNAEHDDGDALRLAVKLELEMYFGDDEDGTSVHVGYAADPDSAAMVRYCIQPSDANPYAATRRAIVRAAAETARLRGHLPQPA